MKNGYLFDFDCVSRWFFVVALYRMVKIGDILFQFDNSAMNSNPLPCCLKGNVWRETSHHRVWSICIVFTIPETNTNPWKLMDWKMNFPFGKPYFSGSFSEVQTTLAAVAGHLLSAMGLEDCLQNMVDCVAVEPHARARCLLNIRLLSLINYLPPKFRYQIDQGLFQSKKNQPIYWWVFTCTMFSKWCSFVFPGKAPQSLAGQDLVRFGCIVWPLAGVNAWGLIIFLKRDLRTLKTPLRKNAFQKWDVLNPGCV